MGGKKWLDTWFTMSTFIPTHQRARVRQRSSLVCSSLQVFSRCNSIFPGVILAVLLHGLFSFNYVHCKLDLLLAPTARQSDRHRPGERGDWPVSVGEDRQNSVALGTAEHHQLLLNDLLAVSLLTGKRKMWRKLSVGRTWKRAKRLLAWQGSRWRRAQTRMSPTSLSEKTKTWCSLIADSLAQNKPVVSIRHHNQGFKERSKDNQRDRCNFAGRKDWARVQPLVIFPMQVLCSHRDNHLSNRDLPRDEPRQ